MSEVLAYPGGAFVRARPAGEGLVSDPHRLSPMPYASLHYLGWRLPHQQLHLLEAKAHGRYVIFPEPVPLPHPEDWGEEWCVTKDEKGELGPALLPMVGVVDWTKAGVREALSTGYGASDHPPFASVCVRPEESFVFWSDEPFFVRVWNAWPVTEDEASVFTAAAEHAMGTSGWHEMHAALDLLSEDWRLMDMKGAELRQQARDLVHAHMGDPSAGGIAEKIVEIVEAGGMDGVFDFRMPLRPQHEQTWQRLLRLSRKHTAKAVDLAAELEGAYAAHRELGASPWA